MLVVVAVFYISGAMYCSRYETVHDRPLGVSAEKCTTKGELNEASIFFPA